jgi:hypothetical protein
LVGALLRSGVTGGAQIYSHRASFVQVVMHWFHSRAIQPRRQPPEPKSYENEVNKFFTMNGWLGLPLQKNSNLLFIAY